MKKLGLLLFIFSFALLSACDDDDSNNANNNNNNNSTTETICNDGVDNDNDGDIDCADSDCANDASCVGTVESICDDGIDNDNDGDIDCADSDCADNAACNGNNNNTSGKVGDPCTDDSDCTGTDAVCLKEQESGTPSGYCVEPCDADGNCADPDAQCVSAGTSSFCAKNCTLGGNDCREGYECVDVQSDSGLGACWSHCTDDAQCTTTNMCDEEQGFCETPAEVCDNNVDDDFDGDVDCDDSDCAPLPECGCPEDALGNTDSTNAYTIDVSSMPASVDGQICGPAFSDWFEFTASDAAMLSVKIEFTHDDGDLDLYIYTEAGDDVASSLSMSDNEEATFDASASATYLIEVQGYNQASNAYHLTVDYAPASLDATWTPTEAAPGDNISFVVTLTNNGGLDANNISVELTSSDADVTVDSSSASVASVPMDGTALVSNLSFSVAASHINNQPVELNLHVTDDAGDVWDYPVSIAVPFGNLDYINFAIQNESTSNGYIDAGETFDVVFDVINKGSLVVSGPVSVAVTVDASSTVTGAVTVTASGSTECSASDMAVGDSASCNVWNVSVPATAQNGEIIVLNISFTDDNGNVWNHQKSLTVGPPSYQSILTQEDAQGDNAASYACDVKDLQAYVQNDELHMKVIFHSACDISGLTDIYMMSGTQALVLTLEAGTPTMWQFDGSWTEVSSIPASYSVTPVSGSSDNIEFSVLLSEVPLIDLSSSSFDTYVGVTDDLANGYTDQAPDADANGDPQTVTFTW